MKIELKRIEFSERLSEETFAFAADVWIDGKKAGDVRNDGRGGCHYFNPYTLEGDLNEYAATLPDVVDEIDYADGHKEPLTYKQSADTVITQLMTDWLIERDLKKLLKSKVVHTRTDRKGIFVTKKLTPQQMSGVLSKGLAALPAVWNVKQCLNLLPFDEALAIYRTEEGK